MDIDASGVVFYALRRMRAGSESDAVETVRFCYPETSRYSPPGKYDRTPATTRVPAHHAIFSESGR